MAEILSGGDIGQVDLDRGKANSGNSISKGDARVRISRRIQNNYVKMAACFLDPTNQITFGVCLSEFNLGLST